MFGRNHGPVLASVGRSSFKCRLLAGHWADGGLALGRLLSGVSSHGTCLPCPPLSEKEALTPEGAEARFLEPIQEAASVQETVGPVRTLTGYVTLGNPLPL